MESSEDDAGAATNASRRASAREKDVGLAEDVNATSSFQQEPSEARPSCETPAMSEDNFDGDSVPSPSAQDVNTSTEAILDMIDEIVDGPGAPKRVPQASESVETRFDELEITSGHANIIQESTKSDCDDSFAPPVIASSADSAKSETLLEAGSESQAESSSVSDKLPDILNTGSVHSLPESSTLPESNEPAVFTQPEDHSLSEKVPEAPVTCPPLNVGAEAPARSPAPNEVLEAPISPSSNVVPEAPASCPPPSVVPEAPTSCPPPIPSSSEEKTVQDNSNVSACETQEQTVKCVSSSDSRDNVTVESAESTSSDSSVSEGKAVLVEPQVRSPLRRRLIRPAPSDRRPDSTVSSTVDSQVAHLPAAEQKSSESITKDVTSSSDAVPTIHGNVKPEEIRNVSEINFCKAETSVSPPKKIKLIRQKVITGTSNRETSVNQSAIQSDKDQCQSTSSDNHSVLLPEPQIESSNTISIPQSQDANEASIVSNCVSEKPDKSPEQVVCSGEHSLPSIEHRVPNEDVVKHIETEPVILAEPSICLPNSSEPVPEADDKISETVQEVSSMPDPTPAEPPGEVNENDIGQGSADNVDQDICKDSKEGSTPNAVLIQEKTIEGESNVSTTKHSELDNASIDDLPDQKKVPPIKLNLSMSNLSESKLEAEHPSISKNNVTHEESELTKQVPKLTIKLKQPDDVKSPVPKVTIKPIRPPAEQDSEDINEKVQPVPSVTKINIKPILKPPENSNEKSTKPQHAVDDDDRSINSSEQLPCITKLNIKPIPKPPEKINDIHRKSSSSEISESEYSENDETSTSDQASTSDQGPSDVVPKVTIKLGKPGTESEGKFYTEKNVPKLTIKGFQPDDNEEPEPKLKLVISQSELSSDTQPEKIPKLTIKTVSKSESQPLSPKLTIKPIKPPDTANKDGDIPKLKISTESFTSSSELKESSHVPKITIKPVTRSSTAMCDSPEHIPVVTKLNIKPIVKPTDSGDASEDFEEKVPVVSKLNIKPVIKPKDNDVDSSVDDVPKITKLNIKPIKNPEENSSEEKDCDEMNADIDENSIPVVTKINIKPIIKPQDEETLKDSENQSSETGNSSDDYGDHIPVVTKLNIKPIIKPDSLDESSKTVSSSEQSIPVITKLNIKPLIKPGESGSPSSPKKEHSKIDGLSPIIPVVTKLNIKPILRPEETELAKAKDDSVEKAVAKNPPLVMKINMKTMAENYNNEHACNNVSEETLSMSPKMMKVANTLENKTETCLENKNVKRTCETVNDVITSVKEHSAEEKPKQNCVPDSIETKKESDDRTPVFKALSSSVNEKSTHLANVADNNSLVTGSIHPETSTEKNPNDINESTSSNEFKNINYVSTDASKDSSMKQPVGRQKISSLQNCILLKKLLENTKPSLDKAQEVPSAVNYDVLTEKNDKKLVNNDHSNEAGNSSSDKINSGTPDSNEQKSPTPDKMKDSSKALASDLHSSHELRDKPTDNVTKPLEITISDKITNQSSGQDSPRIILKINKTDHGPAAKIITEDVKRPETQQNYIENTQEILNDKQSPKKYANSRRKQAMDTSLNLSTGKRLRSSRIVENTEKTPIARRNMGKRPSTTETSPTQNKEPDLSLLQSKRLKLGQLLSNKSLSITPVQKSPPSPTKSSIDMKQGVKTVNHALLNNENCSKNGNSKLHNILSNLQAQQMQSLPYSLTNCSEKAQTVATDIELNASVSNSDAVEIAHVDNSHPELQEMIINENSDYRDITAPEEVSQDPLEVKPAEDPPEIVDIPKPVELTPQPKKRGRPRKLPVSEGAKPVSLPVPALEERPQRSLRLMRDRPTILQKPRGRGRGRGGRRVETTPPTELETIVVIEPADEPEDRPPAAEIDPTSSRIKLPRMTEALDNMPSSCVTPLSSRRRNSSGNFSNETPELKVMVDSSKLDELTKTPEASGSARGRGSRGGRGGRGRTPRGRGRGRGGGRGAMYMKETMGIYGRVCGPATTTVQLFEEETCMMDDNATPAKPSHLLDEDSQSSVKSSTNESNKLKKSKFADLFDSNKVWTAADVKEYTWPPPDKADVEHKVMMIQEQVAMFLGVKSFKRRYAELKRRTISGEERDYVLSKGLVTEALCDLGITAVDASEVLDIMLSDYPHKYEEYRSHQRQRQLTETVEEPVPEVKTEEKVVKVEMKPEKPVEHKPELPKIDPEKTRQDMAMAAMASASEWNARTNALRRGACADLQSLTVLRARPPPRAPARPHLRPPAGFYPHALLPGQYQHSYRVYTPDQLRYFPLNTVVAAPPAPASEDWSSESEPDWGSRFSSSDDSDVPTHHTAKRKKLTKTKRSSNTEVASSSKEDSRATEEVDLCRVCKMRLEANRRYTHERFLVCAHCNAKLHPSCLELSADTIRKCREYAWQCAECKSCCACRQPADDDKMLFCDLCDRGFHIYCVGLETVPSGRWHCVECAVCKSCGARSAGGDWHHQTRRGPGGHKVYSHSLCTPCARVR